MRGTQDRRVREQLQVLANERGNRDDAAQRAKDALKLVRLIADLNKRASDLAKGITEAEANLALLVAAVETEIADVEAQIPPVAASVAEILTVLNGGAAGQLYIKGAAALGGVWTDLVGSLSGGSLVEVTSNSNGIAYRHRSGLMVCFSPTLTLTPNVAAGDIFESAAATWTFPVAFSSAPAVSPCQTGSPAAWVAPYSALSSQVSARLKSHESAAGAITFRLRAEGQA